MVKPADPEGSVVHDDWVRGRPCGYDEHEVVQDDHTACHIEGRASSIDHGNSGGLQRRVVEISVWAPVLIKERS